jgi:hypothetical protein
MRKFIDERMAADGIDLKVDFESELGSLQREMVVPQARCSIVPNGYDYDELRTGELGVRVVAKLLVFCRAYLRTSISLPLKTLLHGRPIARR